jgi:hypothetical protein
MGRVKEVGESSLFGMNDGCGNPELLCWGKRATGLK